MGIFEIVVSVVVVLGGVWYWIFRECREAGTLWQSLLDYSYVFCVFRVPLISRGLNWTHADIPPLEGKTAVVTGSNGGIGYETALELAKAGAQVVLAVRNKEKGLEAKKQMLERIGGKNIRVEVMRMDLCSLKSIEEFCKCFLEKYGELDILVNNAGVMIPPGRRTTEDGFELQFGTNHLGHFALTSRLLPALMKRQSSRVVNVSSLASHQGSVDFDDLMFTKRPTGWPTYAQSKLSNILFTREFQRRSEEGGWGVKCYAAHPGISSTTGLVQNGPGDDSIQSIFMNSVGRMIFPSADVSAIPVLFAATADDAKDGGYYGPTFLFEIRDGVKEAVVPPGAMREDVARKLWNVSTQLTGIKWPEMK